MCRWKCHIKYLHDQKKIFSHPKIAKIQTINDFSENSVVFPASSQVWSKLIEVKNSVNNPR